MNINEISLTQIDELGLLLAQIADLQAKADKIKEGIKDTASKIGGGQSFEGNLYKAVYSESNVSTVDWKAIAKKLEIPASVIAANTKTAARFTLKVEAK